MASETSGRHETAPLPYVPLPSGLREPLEQAREVFDKVARLYDEGRPGYPPEAMGALVQRCGLGHGSRVLEIGCGTGQATRDLARSGAVIRCLEPGVALAELARTKLAGFANVDIAAVTFEADDDAPGSYDAVVSATAFHWIDPSISFAKAARILRTGGSLALLTNAHAAGGTHTDARIAEPIAELHRRFAPEIGTWKFPTFEDLRDRAQAGGDIAAVWSRVERRLSEPPQVAGLFDPPTVTTYPWQATYDRDGYLRMLASQSSYALLDEVHRSPLLDAIGQLVDERLGGKITKQYVTVVATATRLAGNGLVVARRPLRPSTEDR